MMTPPLGTDSPLPARTVSGGAKDSSGLTLALDQLVPTWNIGARDGFRCKGGIIKSTIILVGS